MFPPRRSLIAVLAASTAAVVPTPAQAASPTPHLSYLRCTPARQCTRDPHAVHPRGTLIVGGRHLARGLAVVFPRLHRPRQRAYVVARLRAVGRQLRVTVPGSAVTGRIYVVGRDGRRSNTMKVRVLPVRPPVRRPPTPPTGTQAQGLGAALTDQGMWIWYVSSSSGGNLDAIAARARASHVGTVFVKSSDGSGALWSQFSPAIVQGLKTRGLHVCAWQFVYGDHPAAEADRGAQAKANGAECLVIDAEDQYDGKYQSAQTYMNRLRNEVGPAYPIGLASFPYVDYHPSVPYSVFLGPNGAQANLPQMYWQAIGTSVESVYAHTYTQNRIYGRTILPLGQTYDNPPRSQIVRFRQLALNYSAPGVSFWSWQSTSSTGWGALAQTVGADPSYAPVTASPVLAKGAKGDEVVWLQEHLAAAEPNVAVDGDFGNGTATALRTFQAQHGLPQTARTDPATWNALLSVTPVTVQWKRGARAARSSRAKRGGTRVLPAPRSAKLRSRDELHGQSLGRATR